MSRRSRVFYAHRKGVCMLVVAASIRSAERKIRRAEGYADPFVIRRARRSDVEWVRSMGGYVPEGIVEA